jgi:hypothetical protein
MSPVPRLLCFLLAASAAFAGENDWFVPLGLPPVASPKRISGGESFPPLPLPATPLRRSERKREPAPPKLAGKVIWGESATYTYANGLSAPVADWNLCPADLQQLLRKAGGTLAQPYTLDTVSLASFDPDPVAMPLLFFSGSRTLRLPDDQLAKLRDFVLRGGTLLCDSVAGSPYFTDSVRTVMQKAFPDSPFRLLPPDHPVYQIVYPIDKVAFPKNRTSQEPRLEAIYIGSRAAVILSPFGLGTGWDDHDVPLLPQAVFYDVKSASQIGVNLIAYVIGYAEAGREEGKPELFGARDQRDPTDEFVFAQIRHEGAWNAHPGAAAALLRRLRSGTALRASLKRAPVDPGKDDLSGTPFLFLSGLDDFRFGDEAAAALRRFLAGSGTLVINNALGLKTFDAAVRRELKRLLPEAAFETLPADHPVYRAAFTVGTSGFSPEAAAVSKSSVPILEGIAVGGELRVIYSPIDLEAGWLGCPYPAAKTYEAAVAMPMGVNLVLYAMTH